jgi:hypothetical protein
MDPKSGKPPRIFNPLTIWTDIALKSGTAMLEAAQAAVTRRKAPKVAVIPTDDAPPRKAAPARKPKAKVRKSRKSASSRARRRGR